MKSKAALSLMEQVIMLLVFAFAAAICLKAFVWADNCSQQGIIEDRAIMQLETAAETIKYYQGDFHAAAGVLGGQVHGQVLSIAYDEAMNLTAQDGSYYLTAEKLSPDNPLLGQASLELTDSTGQLVAQLPVCWQEVSGNG